MKKTIHIFLILFTVNNFVNAQAGSLDLSFGTGGMVTTSISGTDCSANTMAIQADGKIILAGNNATFSGNNFALVRYNVDGSLDTSFNSNGIVETNFGVSTIDISYSIKIQVDGKILLGGESYGTNRNFALARYNSNGTLDTSFNSDGMVVTNFGGTNHYGKSVALQADGKILIAGYIEFGSYPDFVLARYNSNGSLDFSFSLDGVTTTSIGGWEDMAYTLALQPDGKIIVAGTANTGFGDVCALVRYNSNGTLDPSFDSDGISTIEIGGQMDIAKSIAILSDGKIIVSGHSYNGTNSDFFIAKLKSDGSLDSTFGISGKITTDFFGFNDNGEALLVQVDGKILVAGASSLGSYSDFALARYDVNGTLDNSFDTDGKITTSIGSYTDYGSAAAIQSDGKILVAGFTNDVSQKYFALARYNASPIGIQEAKPSSTLNLFPNPTTGKINLELNQSLKNASIKIIDLTGQTILSQQNMSGNYFTFDVSNYSTGLYFLEVEENGNFERIKFVKE